MNRKKFIAKNVYKRKIYFSLLFAFILLIGLGYSNIVSNLSVEGSVSLWKYDHTLYGVLERASRRGVYARKYTGDHQDSWVGNGTKDIYHWYGSNNTNGTAIQDMYNVIFAGHCWQMLRTTDTGGVKLFYNGEPENNQCLDTRSNHGGYGRLSTQNLNNNYYYGTSYEYDKENSVFYLSGIIDREVWSNSTYESLVGKYTCLSTVADDYCSNLYYIKSYLTQSTANVLILNSNINYSSLGSMAFNPESFDHSIADAGYMKKLFYPSSYLSNTYRIQNSSVTLSTSYYFASSIDYDTLNPGEYTLVDPVQVSTLSDYSDLIGKYMVPGSYTSYSYGRYVVGYSNNKIYYKELRNGDLTVSLTVGDSYTESGGIYTLVNPQYITFENWYNGGYSGKNGKYVCDGNNTSCSNLRHISLTRRTDKSTYSYYDTNNTYYYSESVSYNNGVYTLSGDVKQFWDIYDSNNQDIVSTHHYTCFEDGTTCEMVGYVCQIDSSLNFVTLENVENIEAAIQDMLYADDVNTYDSTIKETIELWYSENLTRYDHYLEDTIFCNNRTINDLGGLDPDGGDVETDYQMTFGDSNNSLDLSCDRDTDQFSTLNSKAKLNYKVGLITAPEINLLNNKTLIKPKAVYWTMTPISYSDLAVYMGAVNTLGNIIGDEAGTNYALRPVISLKPGIEYASGSGRKADPYIVETTPSTLSLNKESLTLRGIGDTFTLIASTNLTDPVIWTSSNSSVATVDSNGVVTSVAYGSTIITAKIGIVKVDLPVSVLTPFEYDSWDTIIANVQANNASEYVVGHTKDIDMGSLGIHTLRIANTSTPTECGNSSFSQTACGFVLEFADVITTHSMNTTNTNAGGWPVTSLRTYANSDILSTLPEVLKNAIADTRVISGHGSTSGETTNYTTTDKLYLLSYVEVYGVNYNYDSVKTTETRQLDYYSNFDSSSINAAAVKKYNNTSQSWWRRSPHSVNTTYFGNITNNGNGLSMAPATNVNGVSLAFRLG